MTSQSTITTMLNKESKKPKSLKDFKKAQKGKQAAKRATAAANFKTKKAVIVVLHKEEPVAVAYVEVPQVTVTAPVDEDVPTKPITAVQVKVDDTLSSEAFDIHTHRKALEAVLYESMETPQQMLARIKFVVTVDAEYHPYDELRGDEDETALKCRDDNGFEVASIIGSLQVRAAVSTLVAVKLIQSQQETTHMNYSMTIHEMFSKVKSEGIAVVGSSGSKVSRTLESVELEMTRKKHASAVSHSVTIDQLFTSVTQTGKTVLRAETMNNPSVARSVESIEHEMAIARLKVQDSTFATENTTLVATKNCEASEELKALVVIKSSSVTKSSPGTGQSSRNVSGAHSPLTPESVSPPPPAAAGQGYGPTASFGPYYPVWAKPMWAETFAEAPYTCAPPSFSYGGQSFYTGPAVHPWSGPYTNGWHYPEMPSVW